MEELKYPIGRFKNPGPLSASDRKACVDALRAVPAELRKAVAGLSEAQLDQTYRPGGWTLRQVVHHVADSHLNAYQRFKLALTEDRPRIKTYKEGLWAEELDARTLPVEVSLKLLESLHERWVTRLAAMDDKAFARTLDHPEVGDVTLEYMLAMYAWHGRHHTSHITGWRSRTGA